MYQPTIPEDGAGVTAGEILWIGVLLVGSRTASQLASGDFRASQWRASEWLG